MDCGLNSPEALDACIEVIKRWLPVLINLAGVGSLALISILIWLFQRLRKDLAKWEEQVERHREQRLLAEDVARQAQGRATFAEAAVERAHNELDQLRDATVSGDDEARAELALARQRASEAEARIDNVLAMTAGGMAEFWSQPISNRFDDYERRIAGSIPILLFGNQKGGVGKSTLVTNLAAAFHARGERVLTVDLDYQGSHSNLAKLQALQHMPAKQAQDPDTLIPESLVDHLFEDTLEVDWIRRAVRKVQTNLHYVPAFYPFEQTERRIEYQWALGIAQDDVRYRLARALLSDEIAQRYDRVLIDAPPRFTLGFVNGFCAATHLYVPTVVDALSALSIQAFSQQFYDLRPIVNPGIRWPGIIGSMTFVSSASPLKLPTRSAPYADRAERLARMKLGGNEPTFIRNPVIKRDANLAHAAENGIAYLNEPSVRPMFDALAAVIQEQAPRRT